MVHRVLLVSYFLSSLHYSSSFQFYSISLHTLSFIFLRFLNHSSSLHAVFGFGEHLYWPVALRGRLCSPPTDSAWMCTRSDACVSGGRRWWRQNENGGGAYGRQGPPVLNTVSECEYRFILCPFIGISTLLKASQYQPILLLACDRTHMPTPIRPLHLLSLTRPHSIASY